MEKQKIGIVFAVLSVISFSIAPLVHAIEPDQLTFRGKQYDKGSECDFMVLNYQLAPAYDHRQVQSLMLFDKGLCDPQDAVDLTDCPYYVIEEYKFCEIYNSQ